MAIHIAFIIFHISYIPVLTLNRTGWRMHDIYESWILHDILGC